MKRCKRFISALLCLVMVCAILPLSAAANEDTGDGSGDTTETAKLMGYVGQFVSNGSDGFEWVAGTEGSDSGAVLYGSAENMMIEFYADGTKVTDQLGLSSSNPAVAAIEYHPVGAWTVTIKGAGTTEFSVTISNVTYVYVFSVVDNSGSNESNDQLMFRYADSSEIHSLANFPTEIGTSVDVIFQYGGKDLTTTVIEASPSNVVVFTHKGSGVYTAAIQAAGTVQLRYSGPELVGMSEVLGTVTIPPTTPENPGSDEQLKFMYVEDSVWLDMAQFPTTIGETYQLYFSCGGELSGGMFTSSDTSVVEFQGEYAGPNGRLYKFHIAGAGTTTLTYTKDDKTYSAEITIPEGSTPTENSGAAYIGEYVIGFSLTNAEIFSVFESGLRLGFPYPSLPGTDYIPFHTTEIAAAKITTVDGSTVVHEKVGSDEVTLSIKKTWIKVIEDDQEDGSTLSFSNSGLLKEKTDYSDCTIKTYMKEGYTALAEVYAEVEVTIGGVTQTVTVSCMFWPNIMLNTEYFRPGNDTVEALNQFLEQLVDAIDDTSKVYKVVLASQTYEGTIIIPDALENNQQLALFGQEDGSTVVSGSVDLNGRSLFELNKITFKAPSQGCLNTTDQKTTALANGEVTNMYSCTFEGYEVAVDIFHRMVTVTSGNTFIDNEIAIRMDMTQSGGNRLPWVENLYVRNGTAVQILGVSNAFPAYYFRITDSDFIGNDVDFDIQCEGTFYFHRNYFGELLDGAKNMEADDLLEYLLQADTEAEYERYQKPRGHRTHRTHQDGCKVFADIHWKFPNRGPNARNSWETSYTNVLISDWEQETQISNEDTGNMILDSSAFDTETDNKKTIHIVDEHENAIGTWFFD